MSSINIQTDKPIDEKEDEIFKSLSHDIRRKIIKVLGTNNSMSFTQIKNGIGNIDSPTLSYHLKSLKLLIDQEEQHYKLTEIGTAALNLIGKIDQSAKLKKFKRHFLYANIATIACWTSMQIIVSYLIGAQLSRTDAITMVILFQVFAQLNYQIVFQLWGRSWAEKKVKKQKEG
jgi:DNA-binding transcriptional ArsR family regulator